jgi:hypothetical protein
MITLGIVSWFYCFRNSGYKVKAGLEYSGRERIVTKYKFFLLQLKANTDLFFYIQQLFNLFQDPAEQKEPLTLPLYGPKKTHPLF